jgi:hypothetical protein
MSCETMSFRRYGERRQRRQCCVRRPQVGQPASYLSIQLPIVAQLLAHDACFLRSTEDPVHGRAGSHPKSLFRALSLSLPPSKPISASATPPEPARRRLILLSLSRSALRRCIFLWPLAGNLRGCETGGCRVVALRRRVAPCSPWAGPRATGEMELFDVAFFLLALRRRACVVWAASHCKLAAPYFPESNCNRGVNNKSNNNYKRI